MNAPDRSHSIGVPGIPNDSGAAAILAAALGSFSAAVLAFAEDKSAAIKNSLNFYKPTGPLSGVTTVAILIWFVVWGLLEWRRGKKKVVMGRTITIAFVLLVLSLLLTFPPIVDIF